MEIKKEIQGERAEIKVIGRMDAYWAGHLAAALNEAVREGLHQISLDLSEVNFISSAGVGVLIRCYKQLEAIRGTFAISSASKQVTNVVALSGLKDVLLPGTKVAQKAAETPAAPPPTPKRGEKIDRPEGTFEIFQLAETAKLSTKLIGNPDLLRDSKFAKQHCTLQAFEEPVFALGVGTLGDTFEDCEGRFGEFLAAAGAVAYLPTDGTNMPDYFVPAGKSVATVQVCYAATFQGPFARMARFEAGKESGPATLTQLAETCLELSAAERIGMVVVAETSGLIGAALRKPPVETGDGKSLFAFPDVRHRLMFTAERAYPRSLALVVGLVSRADGGTMSTVLRPMGTRTQLTGHFHAAAFGYRHLQKGEIDLKSTVRSLFDSHSLQGVLHLLSDDREVAGAGESEFLRGAVWMGPLA